MPGAALSRAMAAHQAGRLDEADGFYRSAIEADPHDAQALRLRGILARERGRLEMSGRLLARAAEVAPAEAAPLCELALTAMAADDLDEAVRCLRRALAREPAHRRSLANLGALLQYRGHLLEAIGCHEQALALDEHDVEVRCNLAKALVEAGRGEEALAACDTGLRQSPFHPLLLGARGAVLCDLERFSEAVTALEGAVVRHPDDDMALVSLAYAQARLGRDAAAGEALRAALRANPASGRATADLVNLLAGGGDVEEALQLAAGFLSRHPGERHVLAAQAFALRDAGQTGAADALLDFGRLLEVSEPAVPAQFGGVAAFCGRLAALVAADPSLVASPMSKATRGGLQTGELDLGSDPALAALAGLVEDAVTSYVRRLPPPAGAASAAAAGSARVGWSLRAWGTILEEGGYQLPHIHPQGWVSGVYYLALPADMQAAGEQAGWLEFGGAPGRFRVSTPPPTVAVEPRIGRLVLFPSYFYHRTLAFRSTQRRLSIAFDVVPRAGGPGQRSSASGTGPKYISKPR